MISQLLHGDLPPVGHALVLRSQVPTAIDLPFQWQGDHAWVDSGTSALALALLDLGSRRPQLSKPRVIIPGYCCPDLVAACEYAGMTPVAVDINPEDPGYDLQLLTDALSDQVVAVIAINFLGVSERLEELRKLLASWPDIALIEDNAQWFPGRSDLLQTNADYISFSFGRGKPLSLLGGGLLLSRTPLAAEAVAAIELAPGAGVAAKLKAQLYNALLAPRAYQLLSRNPLLGLGQTRFHPKTKISAMDKWRESLLAANFVAYCHRHRAGGELVKLTQSYSNRLAHLQTWHWQPDSRAKQLLRYPLLLSSPEVKQQLLARLVAAGLGASPLYPAEITAIDGIDGRVLVQRPLVNARDFAARFMTLPLHLGVTEEYQRRLWQLLEKV